MAKKTAGHAPGRFLLCRFLHWFLQRGLSMLFSSFGMSPWILNPPDFQLEKPSKIAPGIHPGATW
jgi:hypothetical protein